MILLGFLLTFVIGQRRDGYAKALSLATLGNFLDARALVREKLEEDPTTPTYLLTIKGHGYTFAKPGVIYQM